MSKREECKGCRIILLPPLGIQQKEANKRAKATKQTAVRLLGRGCIEFKRERTKGAKQH
jgi:hypothetical protein